MNMVKVTMRNKNHIHSIEMVILRICWVSGNPRVDDNDFSGRESHRICPVAQPRNFYHASSLLSYRRSNRQPMITEVTHSEKPPIMSSNTTPSHSGR